MRFLEESESWRGGARRKGGLLEKLLNNLGKRKSQERVVLQTSASP